MKKQTLAYLVLVALSLVLATTRVQAASMFGFNSDVTYTPGGAIDEQLSEDAIGHALLNGIQSAGFKVNGNQLNGPRVTFDASRFYVPSLNNLRVLSSTIALRDDVVINGVKKTVSLCDWSTSTWRAGPSVDQAINGILNEVRQAGVKFAQHCMK